MTENQIYARFIAVRGIDGLSVFWRAPSFPKFRTDIFGVFDVVVAYHNDKRNFSGFEFYQLTSLSNMSKRVKKVKEFCDDLHGSGVHSFCENSFVWAYDKEKKQFKTWKYGV